MTTITRIAAATSAMALALSIGAAWANEKDRTPSSTSPTTQSQARGSSPSTMPPSSTTTSPTSTSTSTSTTGASSTTASTTGKATGRPFVQFKDLDTNADGTISADELGANTSVQLDLAQYDSNKDGKLSESEYARYKNQMARNNPPKDESDPEQR